MLLKLVKPKVELCPQLAPVYVAVCLFASCYPAKCLLNWLRGSLSHVPPASVWVCRWQAVQGLAVCSHGSCNSTVFRGSGAGNSSARTGVLASASPPYSSGSESKQHTGRLACTGAGKKGHQEPAVGQLKEKCKNNRRRMKGLPQRCRVECVWRVYG
jgi:hypothetical protein